MSLGLLGAYHGSSDSDSSDEESSAPATSATSELANKPKLANPFEAAAAADTYKPSYMVETKEYHGGSAAGGKQVRDSSVFSNPFKAKEDRKRALLERHVEMTAKQEDSKMLRGKKICWNFRKGRCRFGSKCTFAHDNDVAKPGASDTGEGGGGEASSTTEGASGATGATGPPPVLQLGVPDPDPATATSEDNSSAVISHNKRKRPGLTDGLTPSKKASKFYNKVYSNSNSSSK